MAWSTYAVLLAVVLAGTACNDGGETGTPCANDMGPDCGSPQTTFSDDDTYFTCEEWLSRDVPADEVAYGCDQGDNNIAGTAVYECSDGRTLYWNDVGWGYVGEPMHAHEDGADKVAPEAERAACPA